MTSMAVTTTVVFAHCQLLLSAGEVESKKRSNEYLVLRFYAKRN